MDAAIALRHIATRDFRRVDQYDIDTFGIADNTALISWADQKNEKYTIIIEGNNIRFVDLVGNITTLFQLPEVYAQY